jgi:DNA repair protein RadC
MTEHSIPSRTIKISDAFGQSCQVLEEKLIEYAQDCITTRFEVEECLVATGTTKDFVRLKLAPHDREVFYVIWLNCHNEVLKHEPLFLGTVDCARIHPREVVRAAISCNASAAIFAHNHPSGHSQPSQADIEITRNLKAALSLIDVKTLDHMVVGNEVTSMAELGLI